MDPFSDLIGLLRPSAAFSKPMSGRGRWGVRYGDHKPPGFMIVLKGECWLSLQGREPLRFQKGDFLLLPSTPAFTLSSHPDADCVPRDPLNAPVRYGEQEGEPDFLSLAGTFRIEQVNAPLLLTLLPALIHIPAAEGRADKLHQVIAIIMEECASEEPGKEMVLQRMLEVLLVGALRWRGVDDAAASAGLLDGMHDPILARVLRAIHGDVRANWTVASLANIAGLSRSAFAARFSEVLGCGPIEYLSRWRMALAKDALMRGTKTLDRIADEIGYESASAFSTAFRKRTGCSPGKFARMVNGGDESEALVH